MKNSILGWKSVFCFAFVQDMKNKVIRIATLVLFLISLAVCPLIMLLGGGESESDEKTNLKNVYVVDYTGLNLLPNLEVLKSDTYYEKEEAKLYTAVEFVDRTLKVQEAILKQNEENPETLEHPEKMNWEQVYTFREEHDAGIYMELTFTGESIVINYVYDKETTITEDDVYDFADFVTWHFQDVLAANQNISEEDRVVLEAANNVVYYKDLQDSDSETGEGTKPSVNADEEEESFEDTFSFEYALVMIVVLMLSMAGGRISVAILTEKSSKIMEYLLTSIRPMAIVVGKVLACLLTLCVQGGAIVAGLVLSVVLAGFMNGNGAFVLPKFIKDLLDSQIVKDLGALECILAIVVILLGFFFYGLLGALAGAAVSRMEDVAESAKIYSFVMVIGAYLGMFTSMAGNDVPDVVLYLAYFLPISSMFIVPGRLLDSNISLLFGGIAIVVLLVSLVLLVKFVAGVYESLVYYNGSPLKFKDILRMSKENRKQNKTEQAKEGES